MVIAHKVALAVAAAVTNRKQKKLKRPDNPAFFCLDTRFVTTPLSLEGGVQYNQSTIL
jgi:hypothetical protein